MKNILTMSQISQIPNSTITNLVTGKNDGLNVVIQMTREDLIYLVNTLANRNNNTHFGEWLTVEQTAEAFGLSKNNIKNAKWRKDNNFPTHSTNGPGSSPMFYASEVDAWLKNQR